MYIFDCLYGKIEFDSIVYRCMLTPEMQRLREVRLGNINSIFLTGCANINRFEHSIGTAYLAQLNCEENKLPREERRCYILAALFHDLANGPFGHSYEYIREKQGFSPEKSIGNVINAEKTGSHKRVVSIEPIYMGLQPGIHRLVSKADVQYIDDILVGKNEKYSKLISDIIDIDNIDNVFRMAYHMGIPFKKNIPLDLVRGMRCIHNNIYFENSVMPYLFEWYETRQKVYRLLLYNPQDFSAKYMLSEAMDSVLDTSPVSIKWNSTDEELIETLRKYNAVKIKTRTELKYFENDTYKKEEILDYILQKKEIREIFRECYKVDIPEPAKNFEVEVSKNSDETRLHFYSTNYFFTNGKMYKEISVYMDAAKSIIRLMTGDLYPCLMIFKSKKIIEYEKFIDFKNRMAMEYSCNQIIEKELSDINVSIGFHAILDKEKTNRQINVKLMSGEEFVIGKSTKELLIGIFIKTPAYGLVEGKKINKDRRNRLIDIVKGYLEGLGLADLQECTLYSEVDEIE